MKWTGFSCNQSARSDLLPYKKLSVESVWTTTVTTFKIRFGLEILPNSKRRKRLEDLFEQVLQEAFAQRILSFDASAAQCASILASKCRKSGRSVEFRDTMIAGIIMARSAKIITRNPRHFNDLDIQATDPSKANND